MEDSELGVQNLEVRRTEFLESLHSDGGRKTMYKNG